MKKQTYLAIGNHGTRHWLNDTAHPRKALLHACGASNAHKIYTEHIDGKQVKHVGYVVLGEWFDILKVEDFKSWELKL